ncbi:MAG TPA: AraC family transcriptional regulator [Pyrinomonadaceae bacterium]|nr:AraC family transcriptional regulator [Pyrinomonadaceae bacterium]
MRGEAQPEQVKFCHPREIDGLELGYARYRDHAFPRHLHEEYIVGVIVQGVEELRHRGRVYAAPAGSLVLMNPGEPHSNYSVDAQGFTYRTFYPSAALLAQIGEDIAGRARPPCFPDPVVPKSPVYNLLLRLHVTLEQDGSALERESEFISAMAELFAAHGSGGASALPVGGAHRYVGVAREYLEANYAENVSLRQLAAVCDISPFHLLRTFRDAVGLPPFEYQTQLRISHAKRLLRDGWSIADAAAETGFADQSHLTRHFKRVVGLTPGKYFARPQ